jgi:hypothetical protein
MKHGDQHLNRLQKARPVPVGFHASIYVGHNQFMSNQTHAHPMQKQHSAHLPLVLAALLAFLPAGCHTVGQHKEPDPQTGHLPAKPGAVATVVKSEKIDMPKYRDLILTIGGTFFRDQTIAFGWFTTVVDAHDMKDLLIKENKAGVAFDFENPVSWKRISDNYKPFLVLRLDERTAGGKRYIQLKAAPSDAGGDAFVAEVDITTFSGIMTGANDRNVYYPLYNAFIDWVKSNE